MYNLIHKISHKHKLMSKPGVGDIILCSRRLLATKLDVAVYPYTSSWPDYELIIDEVSRVDLDTLIASESPTELSVKANSIINDRRINGLADKD